jgi:hypothetical protein
MIPKSNNCVQATPDFTSLFVVAQVSVAPDAERWAASSKLRMKTALLSTLACGVLFLSGCIQRSSMEQRVVELPAGYPNASFDTAAQIGKALIANGLGAAIRKQFPALTQKQLQGLYLTWNTGVFQGKQSVYFLTGIRYTAACPRQRQLPITASLRSGRP